MKIKAGRFLLVFVSFNVLFLALYAFTSSLSARIFMEDEAEFIWNAQIQKPELPPESELISSESLLSVFLPINADKSVLESSTISDESELTAAVKEWELLPPEAEMQIADNEPSEVLIADNESSKMLVDDKESLEMQLREHVKEVAVSLSPLVELKEKSSNLLLAEAELVEVQQPVKKSWIEEWEESKAVIVLSHVIHNPFDRHQNPTVYVKRTEDGFQVRLQKSALHNLQGELLAQDHIELWLHDKKIRPPKNYGDISYQFGIGLGEKPWIREFLGTEPSLNLQVLRTELPDFIELQITGLSNKNYEWNLVFSGSFFQQEWTQGYLLSAAENFRWGCPEGLLK